ncbi:MULTISPECIES: DUF7601 domain-containing protein [Clostridia]|uniref:DUF7601 domain-containing protein n=1 Tax=Clostridia TaxID=186801 RepID=UPI000EB27EE1|nr:MULTISPECIES: hypothetical protein [Clostridia]RKQ27034.1 hypothetical protein D8Q48_12425 [Ruminococcus sp. B05]TAP33377.1 hypothetical protein EYA86_07370 [Mediterraneibacter sp. gm002]
MKKGQKKRRSVILRRVLALLLAIVLIHSQIMPAVFAADTNYSQESNTEEKTVVDGAETVLPMSEDAISEPSEPIQSEEQQTEDKVSEDTTVESSEPIQSGEQQTEDTADAEQSPEVETTGEAAEETVNIADAVVPVTVNYYLPKSQNLQVDAPESYTEGEAQEEAKSAVIEQALGDETTQKLIEQQKEKGIESNTQELTASAVSEEEYDSYTQMAVTGEGLQAPEVSLSDDVQLEEDADAENTNPLIGWQVAKTAGIMLSYPDGTEIKMGDVIPADKISEVQMTAADDGISLLSTQANMSIASLIALTQDMTVVQRVGDAGTNGKWSVLVQGGTNQTPSAGTVRHAYGTLKSALTAINTDTTSNSFKITFLDNYTASSADLSAMGSKSSTSGVLGKRTTNKPTIVFTGATNYSTGTSYSSWTTFTSQKQEIYFDGFNAYFTHVNLDWSGSTVYGNQNDTTFDDVKFVGGEVTAIYGGRYYSNSTNVSYNLKFKDVEMTKNAPVKQIFGGGQDDSKGTINLTMTNCTIYGNVYASSGPFGTSTTYTHTGSVYATLEDTAIRKFNTTVVDPMLKPNEIHNVGGSFWGLYGKVTENLYLNASGSYVAECGTWFTAKEDCKVGKSIDYTFNNIKENLRFVGAYQFPGYDQTEAYKGRITVNNTQVANVFGWGWLDLYGSSTCNQDVHNFGHMQYDSSFYHYWTEQKKQNENGGSYYAPGTYTPDLKGCIGYVVMKSSNIYSGGDCFDSTKGWNRQRFGRIVLQDNYNTFRIYNATGGNSTNVVDVEYIMSTKSASPSYKATIELMGRQANTSASSAFSMIHIRENYFSTSVNAIGTLKTHTNIACTMAQDTTNRLIKLYATTNAQNIIYLYSGSSITGNALYSADSFAAVLDKLRNQSGGDYTLWFTRGYTLINNDVTAFNNASGFANKNVTIICEGVIAGSNERNSPNTGLRLWDQVFPNFNSLKWKNVKFRSDFYEFNKYSFVMHGNGHNLTFENCTFEGDVTINAGGNSTQGTSGSTLTLKNCVNVNKIYASRRHDGLGNTTINVESCTGHTGTIIIDPAYYSVKDLEINLKDCVAKVYPTFKTIEVEGDYRLTAENTQLMFTNPTVSSGHTAKVYLNKDSSNHEVVLLGDCKGADNAPAESSSLYVTAKVRPKESTSVNLDYFDQIEINGGELHLGDASNSVTGGFGNSSRAANVSLKNSGKLMLDNLGFGATYRTINSLKTDSTNTEVSVTYDYESGTSGPERPLIIKNALTVPSYSKLRISTTLAPRHKGTVEYPLIQFNSSNNAKLEQYNWIADKQYYLTIGSQNSNQIVLRADTYAPLVYQAKTTNMSMSLSGNQIGQLEIYLKDLYRDGIDANGNSINDASDGAYPTGVQVYLSTQDVQLKDGVYGYTYNSSTDIQLKSANVSSYGWMNSGAFIDINGTSVTATTESPVLHLILDTRTYQANTNYFIYARDIAGNWSKFLLDTKGPTSTYTNITSTKVSDTTYRYTFTGLTFTDPTQTATYGTSDITDVSYKANATQYIQNSKKLDTVRYNKTGKNPWESGVSYSTASLNTSSGACTLSNVSVSVTEKLYVFVKDGYGNISRYTYVPIVFDAQSGGATSTGKFSNGLTTSSTLGLVGSALKSAQVPSSPLLGNQTFRYWYNSKNSGKSQVSLTSVTVSDETTYYYPQWTYPTLTISNQVTGSVADKNKKFTYTIYAQPDPGNRYNGQDFPYTGGTIAGISGVTAPANGTKTGDYNGEFTIELSHGQSVTIQLPGYYDYVSVSQNKESPYWTVYTTEENKQYNQNYTGEISVNATNRSLAFVNSNDSSQPVIYQQKMEGEWTKDQGDNYGRKLTVYIRDLYGDGIDTQGSSFSTSERAEFPGCTYAQVYLSTYDAPKADRGFKFRYNASESERLESLCSCRKLTSGSVTDIEGKTVTATSEKPVWAFKMLNTYKFDQNKNYFIYVRDLTGKWTKYLLDTKGPRIENTGTITKSKENDNDTEFKISKLQVKDEMIDAANGTSDLTNESQENFTYVANATKYKGTEVSLVRNNKTGKFSDTYKTPTKAADGTYTAVESMNNGEMLYVYAQDYYGNTTAQQYVLVGFDASGNAQYKKAIFKDKTRLKRELVAKGQKLSSSQIPSDPGFYNDNTSQKFTQWSDSTDTNKKKVDLKTAQMTKSVILNADYEKPGVIIKQMIKGDGIWNNQEFTYKVKTSYPKGKVIPCKGSYVSPAVNAPNITSLTVDANQEITFKLKAGQSLELIPGDNQYTIKSIIQDSNGTNCEIQKDAKVISSVENVAVDEISTNFVFTNTKNIVVTGVDGGNTDNSLLLVGLMGVLLITGVSVLRVRGRRRS